MGPATENYIPEEALTTKHPETVRRTDTTEEPVEKKRKVSRQHGLKNWVHGLSLALALGGGYMRHSAAGEGSSHKDTITAQTNLKKERPPREDSGETKSAPAQVHFRGETYSADEFQNLALEGIREELGPMADHCLGLEQVFYYYGNQLRIDPKPIAELTGRSTQELTWIGKAMRSGFVEQPMSFGGGYVGMVEAGAGLLPPMKKSERFEFYRGLFDQRLREASSFYRFAHINTRPPKERQELAELAGKAFEAQSELATRTARNFFRAKQSVDFETWFHEGIDPKTGFPSGNAAWDKAFETAERALDAQYAYIQRNPVDGVTQESIATEASKAKQRLTDGYHNARMVLFDALSQTHQKAPFGGEQSERWKDLKFQEARALSGIEQMTADAHE